ncbi:MAG: hypothetical protein FJ102_15550 [Deltaproteobacteria bacterium]|nr:hypothetical protein [Deltaproteobacteria bacterium]
MRALFLAGLLAAGGLAPAEALAGPGSSESRPASSKARITVHVVHATDSETGIDPRLQPLASQFRYLKYKGYRLLSTQNIDLVVGGEQSVTIEGDRKLGVALVSLDESRARVRVEIDGKKGKLIDTTVTINRDGTFIVAGPAYKDGILILPLRASY